MAASRFLRHDTTAVPQASADDTTGTGAGRRPPVRWVAAAAALAIALGLGIWAFTGRGAGTPAVPAAIPSATPVNPLLGTTWQLSSLYGRLAKYAPDAVPFLQFEADGSFTGADPCNRLGGTYRLVEGIGLRLTLAAMTEIGCDVGQQQSFVQALTDTRQLRRQADTLTLLDSAGDVLATFSSRALSAGPSPTPTPPPIGPSVDPDTPTSTVIEPSTGPTDVGDRVSVRVRNDTGADVDQLRVVFPDGTDVSWGPMAAGAEGRYVSVGQPVYAYSYAEVTVSGRTHTYQPVDFVGERRLPAGAYTYVLDLDDGRVNLTLVAD